MSYNCTKMFGHVWIGVIRAPTVYIQYIYAHIPLIHTLLCSNSLLMLSKLLKISSLCSSLLALLINLQMISLSVSKFCQELRVSLR